MDEIKTVTLQKVDVVSVLKTIVIPLTVLGLVLGFLYGLWVSPFYGTLAVNGVVKARQYTPDAFWRIMRNEVLFWGAWGLGISLIATLFAWSYNIFSRLSGGIKIKVKE